MTIMLLLAVCFQSDLAAVLEQHDRVLGEKLAAIDNLQVVLQIEEGGRVIEATYTGTRDGRMRIDVKMGGVHVYTEALGKDKAWQWNTGQAGIVRVEDDAAATMRQGLELPGRFYSLDDLENRGHNVELDGTQTINGVEHPVVKVTLKDGKASWYVIDAKQGTMLRSRDFRQFDPQQASNQPWLETRYRDYRDVEGVMRSFSNVTVDLTTDTILQTVTVQAYRSNLDLSTDFFEDL